MTIDYTIEYDNVGNAGATQAYIEDTIPVGTTHA